MVKFQGDRSRELGERVAKQKKHLGQNISPSGTVVPGGLIMHGVCHACVCACVCSGGSRILNRGGPRADHDRESCGQSTRS